MSVNNIFISKQNFIYRVMVSRLAFAPAESLSLQFREVEQSHSWHNGDASLPLPRSHGAKNNPKSSHLFTLRAKVVEGGRGEDRVVCPPATVVVKFTRTRGTQTNSRLKGRGFCRRPFQVQKSSTHRKLLCSECWLDYIPLSAECPTAKRQNDRDGGA